MVRAYPRATAGVAGVLHGVQKHPDLESPCRYTYCPQLVALPFAEACTKGRKLKEGSHLESRAGRAGFQFDVGAFDGGSGAACCGGAVELIEILDSDGQCISFRPRSGDVAYRAEKAGCKRRVGGSCRISAVAPVSGTFGVSEQVQPAH